MTILAETFLLKKKIWQTAYVRHSINEIGAAIATWLQTLAWRHVLFEAPCSFL